MKTYKDKYDGSVVKAVQFNGSYDDLMLQTDKEFKKHVVPIEYDSEKQTFIFKYSIGDKIRDFAILVKKDNFITREKNGSYGVYSDMFFKSTYELNKK